MSNDMDAFLATWRQQRDVMRARRDALIADCERAIAMLRSRWTKDDDGGSGVREPATPKGRPPRIDQILRRPPKPQYFLDVVGTNGGKATVETRIKTDKGE
jgi:hypothetical protein